MATMRQLQPQQQQQPSPAIIRDIQVRHLASLTSGFGQLTPEKGLQRLRQMELSGAGGTQCRLRLLGGNAGALRVIDPASNQLMENFPIKSMRQPLAYEGGNDNLLMFSLQSEGASWEMHIFQLPASLPASQLAKELHQLSQQDAGGGGGGSEESQDAGFLVQVLNRCLEEVEAFALRLQQQQQQQQRPATPRSHRSGRHSPSQQQSTPALPGTDDFVDSLKKLKLALNLLGKLEGRIHEPNAPELVHCLFVPLALIVQSIGTDLPSRVLSPLLTPDTVALLKHCLTSKECELWYSLGDAWTFHRQRWMDEHQLPPGGVPSYRPRFKRDGWQPELEPELLGQGPAKAPAAAATSLANGNGSVPRQLAVRVINPVAMAQQYSPYNRNGVGSASKHSPQPQSPQRPIAQVAPRGPLAAPPNVYSQPPAPARQSYYGNNSNNNNQNNNNSWDDRQERLRLEAESRGNRVAQALHDKAGRNAKELTVQRGELLEVLDDSRNWWQLRNCVGEVGYVPYTILRLL